MEKILLKLNENTVSATPSILGVNDKFNLSYSILSNGENYTIKGENSQLFDNIEITKISTGYTVKRSITNKSNDILNVKELSFTLNGITFGGSAKDDYFYATENMRLFKNATIPIDLDWVNETNVEQFDIKLDKFYVDPGVLCERICSCPYQPYPAILISNYNSKKGIVVGSLSQDVFYNNYTLKHVENKVECVVYSSFKNIAYRELAKNETIVDEWFVGVTDKADDIDRIFENHTNLVRERLKHARGRRDINRHSMIWDSWNDGIFRDISEELVCDIAKKIKKLFPTCEWIEIDDGYSALCYDNPDLCAHGLGVPYEGEEGIDYKKFPNGLKAFTDKIKEIGLRPAIWVGGLVPTTSKLFTEHPEWFIDYTRRVTDTEPLDVSIPEVSQYMKRAIEVLLSEYGFEGIKHDFWSYAFEDRFDLLKYKNKSGYEHRKWWLKTICDNIPEDGYLEACCDIGEGNPFLSEFCNNYRYGNDIQSGSWECIISSMSWGLGSMATHIGDMYIPNSDSIGLLPNLNDKEFYLWLNYVLITRSMVEISGKFLDGEIDQKRLEVLQKVSCNINNGQDVYLYDFDYRKKGLNLPLVRYINTPHFSLEENNNLLPLKTLALINYTEEEKEITIDFAKLGLNGSKFIVTDVWAEKSKIASGSITYNIGAHDSILIAISNAENCVITDSNVKLSNVTFKDGKLNAQVHYSMPATIFITKQVKEIMLNGKSIDFIQNGEKVKFNIEKGNLCITF